MILRGSLKKKICRFIWAKCHIKLNYAIYIKPFVSLSVCHVLFVPGGQTICLSPLDKHFSHTGEGGANIFRDKCFMLEVVVAILMLMLMERWM